MITQGNEYYIRYVLLLFKGGAALLRAKTENALRTARLTFQQFLQLSKVKTETQKQLTKAQQEQLYPKSGKDASLADLDITVLSHLICLDCIGQDADDLKIAKALREMRNEVAHIEEPQMDFATYNGKWTDLVTLLSLGSSTLTEIEKTGIKSTIDSAAKDPLDIKEVLGQLKLLVDAQKCFENIKTVLQGIEHNIEMLTKTTNIVKEKQGETLNEVKTVHQLMCNFETNQRESSIKIKQGIDDATKTQKETHKEVQACKSTIENVQVSQQQTRGNVMELSKTVLTGQQTQNKTLDEVGKVFEFLQTQQVTMEEMKKELIFLRENYGNITEVLRVITKLEVEPESLKIVKLIVEAVEKIVSNRQNTENRTKVEDVLAEMLAIIEGPKVKVDSASVGSVVLAFRCLSFDAVLQVIDCFASSTFQERITNVAKAIEEVTGQFVRIRAFVDILSLQRIVAYYKEKPKRKEVKLEMACTGIDGLIQAMDTFEGGKLTESVNKLSIALSEAVGEHVKVRTSVDRNQMMKTVQTIKSHTGRQSPHSEICEDKNSTTEKANVLGHTDESDTENTQEIVSNAETKLVRREYVEILSDKNKTPSSGFDNKKLWSFAQHAEIISIANNISYNSDLCFTSGAALSDNRILLADFYGEKLIVIDLCTDSVLQEIGLDGRPFGIALLRNEKAVVTMPESKSLVVIKTSKTVLVLKYITVAGQCWGITSSLKSRNVYVVCWNPVNILAFDIECDAPVYLPLCKNDQRVLLRPLYIALSSEENHLYVTGGWLDDRVLKMTLKGQIVGSYTEEEMEFPVGLCRLDENILICYSKNTGAIHIISDDLKRGRLLQIVEKGAECMFIDLDKAQIFLCYKDIIRIFEKRG